MNQLVREAIRERIFDFLVKFKKEHDGNSPTMRQIRDGCGISSTSVVTDHLKALADRSRISFGGKGDARCINIRGGEWTFHEEYTEPVVDNRE